MSQSGGGNSRAGFADRRGARSRVLVAGALALVAISPMQVAADEPPVGTAWELEVRNVIEATDIGLDTVTALEFETSTGSLLVAGEAAIGTAWVGRRTELDGRSSTSVPAATVAATDDVTASGGTTFALDGVELVQRDEAGTELQRLDLPDLGIDDPQALAIAPTADATDEASATSLYLADTDAGIVELGPQSTVVIQGGNDQATLVNTINAGAWSPPSSDPSGIAYSSALGRLIVVDGEVEESVGGFSHYAGANVWEVTTGGSVVRTWTVRKQGGEPNISNEPVGAAVNPTNGHLFISDDGERTAWEIDRGNDGAFGTIDDSVVATIGLGAQDPEGLAFGGDSLYVADGIGREVWRIRPGADGDFGTSDDIETHFDVSGWIADPEGIEFDPATGRLMVLSSAEPGNASSGLLEATTDGGFIRIIDLGALTAGGAETKYAGIAKGPGGTFFVVDRGADFNPDLTPADGRIYEISFPAGPPPAPPNTSITGGPAQGSTSTSSSASFSFAGTNPPVTFQCRLNGGAFVACTSPQTYTGLANGTHTFTVRAVNAGGTDATPPSRSWTVNASGPPPSGNTPFTDIVGHPFELDIDWLYDEGITAGCTATTFCPDSTVLRDQMASFLDRALPLPATSIDFFDDDDGNIHEAAINRLAASGITGGCDVREYCPKASVRRDQMASFLTRAFDLGPTTTDFFTDDGGNLHEVQINRLAASGITGGCAPGRYCPTQLVSRGQMAAFLHRAILH